MQLGLEDQEQAEGDEEAAEDTTSSDAEKQGKKRAARKRNRGHLPRNLPRIERVIEPEETTCPCCDGQMHVIGEDKSEQLDIRPIALTRKNALFTGSDRGAEHWAIASSIIETCRLDHVDPFVYLKDVLERMASGQDKANQIDQIMPWNW